MLIWSWFVRDLKSVWCLYACFCNTILKLQISWDHLRWILIMSWIMSWIISDISDSKSFQCHFNVRSAAAVRPWQLWRQVKLRGQRVELGEVEETLLSAPAVTEALLFFFCEICVRSSKHLQPKKPPRKYRNQKWCRVSILDQILIPDREHSWCWHQLFQKKHELYLQTCT